MQSSAVLSSVLLSTIGVRLPELIALVVGMIVAIVRWRRSGRNAALGLTGFVLALLGLVLSAASTVLAVWLQVSAGLSVARIVPIDLAAGLIIGLLTAAAWVLIILALFTGKRQSPARG
ncbi:MAG: hypothetical protein GEV03_15165 [Streptosporangiales bacterium]|nr:hypothetical protein [Streptosporangiales bacterium]